MGRLASTDEHENAITVLPATDDHTLCLRLTGVISKEEFMEHIFYRLQKMVDTGEKFNLLLQYQDDFKGWDMDAAQLSFQSIIDNGKQARRLAYVNPPESKIFQVKMAKPLLPGEIRFFNNDEMDEALKWVKQA